MIFELCAARVVRSYGLWNKSSPGNITRRHGFDLVLVFEMKLSFVL